MTMNIAVGMRASLFGSANADPGFPDYTTELKGSPPEEVARAKGPSKMCDICSKPVYREDNYLLHTDIILASDEYIDFVIRGWIQKGFLPASAYSRGIGNESREWTRNDIRMQSGGTPWGVCKSCLHMFSLTEEEKAEAKKRSDRFWAGEKVEGVRAK